MTRIPSHYLYNMDLLTSYVLNLSGTILHLIVSLPHVGLILQLWGFLLQRINQIFTHEYYYSGKPKEKSMTKRSDYPILFICGYIEADMITE